MAPKDFDPEYPDPDDPEDEDFDVNEDDRGEEEDAEEEEDKGEKRDEDEELYFAPHDQTLDVFRRDLTEAAIRLHSIPRWNAILRFLREETQHSPQQLFTNRQLRRLRRRLVRRR